MHKLKISILFLFFCYCSLVNGPRTSGQVKPDGPYPTDPASEKQEGVPEGKLIRGTFSQSKIFPGTKREYAIYVPHQYKRSRAACLMVVQDGLKFIREKGDWKLPVVFDNLIHSGEMPVTIGLFVEPGVVPASNENALARYNRSFEYDAVDDRYVRFLLNEMLPLVEKDYRISKLPDDRAICGSSSGGIAAFNAAWQRPDKFRRVCTTVGTYIGLRGAHEMSTLVRKTEPKPLRVFLQDGSNDLDIYCGDWWIANQGMLSALEFSGYEVNHVWGEGGHNGKHGGAIFPEAMRWLWKDWPKAVETHIEGSRSRANEMLIEGQEWELVSKDKKFLGGVAVDNNGNVFYSDRLAGKIYKLDADENETLFWNSDEGGDSDSANNSRDAVKINGIATGREGQVYVCLFAQGKVIELSPDG
jgi:enterochelin esterase-like enzyme